MMMMTSQFRKDKGIVVTGLRLSCSGVLSRPSPPVPPTTPLTTSSPLSPRVRKPPVLSVGPACLSYLTEGDERGHRRHKTLLPPPPPPPPPPTTTQPKNSIFHGREVIEPKVVCGVKVGVGGTGQPEVGTTGGPVVSGSQRIIGSTGLFPSSAPVPPALPGVRGASLPQSPVPASASIPNSMTGAVPRPCPVPPPIGVPPVPTPPVVQAGLAVLPTIPHGLPGLPPSKQSGPCLSPALTAPQQNPEYPGRPFSRGQFGAPGIGTLTAPISLYSAARLAPPPPPPPPLPPQTEPAGPGLPGPSPSGHVDPARVSGESSAGYSGQDCPAPGTRGS
ncbi:hypothetical protein E2C01_025106 [Portunus trituberculatus]|uniref:Uncharacterized protein n=1 Tax=Portunus trituberculatus TaxID=210409 RepID=A0A5B7EET8_PORTR|nr:hypothetical protein [Portunus trituberculatus]